MTVAALIEDIQRYLSHRPVTAQPDGVAYVLGKFVRRNRLALGVMGIFLALISVAVSQVVIERNRASNEAANGCGSA